MKKLALHLFVLPFFIQFSNLDSKNIISQTVSHVNDIEIITLKKNGNQEPTLSEMIKPINFTPSGLTCYFKHIYNCSKYSFDVLPVYPFKHLEEFLDHGIQTDQPSGYTKAVIRLFDKKFKSSPYINPEKIIPFLQKLPQLLEKDLGHHFSSIKTRKESLKNFVQHELSVHFDDLKQDPDKFISNLSDNLLEEKKQTLKNTIKLELQNFCENPQDVNVFLDQLSNKIFDTIENEELVIADLQNTVTKLIETTLNKVYWATPSDTIWDSFLAIGKELSALHKDGVIRDTDALDDCQWTLTTRFCLFLSASGSDVSPQTYDKARNEIINGIPHLDNLEEQEDLILKKTQHLQHYIMRGKAKADARQEGILSEFVLNI